MFNQGKYEQMNPSSNESFNSPFYKSNLQSSNAKNSKLLKLAILICLAIIFIYILYSCFSRSILVKERRDELLSISSNYDQKKAEKNDLGVQKNRLQQEKSSIEKDKNNIQSTIDSIHQENNRIENGIKKTLEQINYLKGEINKLDQLKDDLTYKIELGKERDLLQDDIKAMKVRIDKLLRQQSNKREDREENNKGSRDQVSSLILTQRQQVDLIKSWFNLNHVSMKFDLCFRLSRDGGSPNKFHKNCSGISNTITLYLINGSVIIGGFAHQPWDGNGFKSDKSAFLFNLTNEKKYPVRDSSKALYINKNSFPSFGEVDLYVTTDEIITLFPQTYGSGKEKKYELTNGKRAFNIEEIEVFHLSYE